ncbi:SREBP regulating gene protein [Taenia solium]
MLLKFDRPCDMLISTYMPTQMRPRDCVVHLGRRFLGITVFFSIIVIVIRILSKLGLWKSVLELAQLKAQVDILSATSVFEFCSARCRTSSESVVNANAYRDPKRRFCFGIEPPELRLMSSSENATL